MLKLEDWELDILKNSNARVQKLNNYIIDNIDKLDSKMLVEFLKACNDSVQNINNVIALAERGE